MSDDPAPATDVPAEAPTQAETSQTPVSDGLPEPIPPAPNEPVAPPPSEASVVPTSEPVAETTQPEPATASSSVEPTAPHDATPGEPAEPQIEPPTLEPKPASATTGAASAASAPSAASSKTPEHDRELLKIARAKIQTNKQQKFEKILKLFDTKEKITNDDVEKALKCSDRSAARYLEELVKQGKIKRIGKTGKAVTYTRT